MKIVANLKDKMIENKECQWVTETYYRGIDPSRSCDFNVCAFRAFVGKKELEIYLKYGLEEKGLQILIFSNHISDFPINQPFKK